MTKIIKREIRNYLKRPWFWLGVLLVIFGTFQNLEPYLQSAGSNRRFCGAKRTRCGASGLNL